MTELKNVELRFFVSVDMDEKYIPRACNHFKRGALDLYKIIIKDFFVLHPPSYGTKEMQVKLFEIREKEYKLIGNDNGRVSNAIFEDKVGEPSPTLFDEYNNLTQEIINFYSNNSSQ